MNAQARSLRDRVARRQAREGWGRTRTIAVTSGKGGVGKTTVAANLAIALQRLGARVVLVDVDLGLANVDVLLGLRPRWTLKDLLAGRRSIREITVDGPAGVRVVPAASGLEELANLAPWEQERLWRSFAELDADADLVLVDTAAGIAPNVLDVLATTEEVVVVAAPEPAAITDAYALIKVLSRRRDDARVHLLVNRARRPQEGYAAAARIAEVARHFLGLDIHCLGCLPEDPQVDQAGRDQVAFAAAYPQCPAARCLASVAGRLKTRVPQGAQGSLADCVRELSRLHVQTATTPAE
ncbi:MAG: MinD/ParA family protein [Candidatus Brocadiia bacterium]